MIKAILKTKITTILCLQIESFSRLLTDVAPGVTPAEVFCSLDNSQYERYFVRPEGNKGDFSRLKTLVCQTSAAELLAELSTLTGGDSKYYDYIVSVTVLLVSECYSCSFT